ncbi:Holliday junction ATP-dependent DNA helicase RuvA [Sinomonas cellulolyticus]|jgi:Holliday junction DNA helicase RuvA|uniref:Holliday junction branch migration complex subunit RuvA n=1 Tax=Sinomonas cellulolyticus TaxID=2801916 RepID=A0ABS1K4E2_9MICC|nr:MULTISPECIES: Holliday junction branch migration protein RuvA [Sinomonas]MBL0705161.1 Holliday junction branch migration protein RuvA [Sinomonas cellulolyticus]GHG39611.1 Holliday junction ATP-dependent DNA helicase RuvA [Sinomonas sp. KCTC 49339]
MISFLRGPVAYVGLSSGVVDVNGAGMSFWATPQTLSGLRVGEEATVHTSLVVREDSLTLYGFAEPEEREVFEVLLGVSGVGPRLALAVLAVHSPEAVRVAAHTEDAKAFTKVPGIGPKVGARLVLELKGKLVPLGSDEAPAAVPTEADASWKPQVVAAMASLGWSEKDATASIDKAMADAPEVAESGSVPEILRATLRWLGQGARAVKAGARG